MNLALDTNRYSDFARGVPEVVATATQAATLHLPLPVVAELRSGFLLGTQTAQNEKALAAFLSQPTVSVVIPDTETTRHYASIYVYLRRKGTPIPVNDIWIAAICIQHGFTLYARDRHFSLIPGLELL